MRKYLVLVSLGTAIVAVFFGLSAQEVAAEQPPLSDAHKERIATHCTEAKASLGRLHRADASLRVNRGQLYEFISTKLMARLNSRLALNRLDAAELVSAAAEYESALRQFRDTYQAYEETLSGALRLNCTAQPEKFYYTVLDARTKRSLAHAAVAELGRLADEYYQAFGFFRSEYASAAERGAP